MLKLSSCWSHKEELLCLLGKNHEKETIMNKERKLRELSVEKSLDDLIAVQVNDPSSKTDGYMAGLSNGLLLAKSLFGHEYHPISYKTLTTPIEDGKHICAAYCDGSCLQGTQMSSQIKELVAALEDISKYVGKYPSPEAIDIAKEALARYREGSKQ